MNHNILLDNRVITGFRMSLCGLLAFLIYHYLHFPEGYWAVVTISAITRPNLSGTFVKALLRLSGTLLGASVGLCLGLLVGNVPWALFLLILCFTMSTTYLGIQIKPFDYFSTVAGFSAVIVIAGVFEHKVEALALYRTLEICLGILVMTCISFLISLRQSTDKFFEKNLWRQLKEKLQNSTLSKVHLIQAFIIGLTASLTFLSWFYFKYMPGIWITITVLVIMEDSTTGTHQKAFVRFLGQVFAALLGGMIAVFCPGNIFAIGLTLYLGFWICGMIIGSENKIASMGNHAGSALAIMLLAGNSHDILSVVEGRFLNVLIGIIIASLVTLSLQNKVFISKK